MASVIKQNSVIHGSRAEPVAFNIEDMQNRARDYLQEMQSQAKQLIEQAKQEAVRIRSQAHRDGVRDAQAEIERRVEELATKLTEERCRTATESCQQMVQQLTASTSQWLAQWRNQTVELAAKIAEKIVRSKMQDQGELLRVWMEEAIVALRDQRDLRVLIHPDDFSIAGRFLQELSRAAPHSGSIEVVPDPEIKPGGCIVKSRNGQIDLQLETQLQRLVDQLAG